MISHMHSLPYNQCHPRLPTLSMSKTLGRRRRRRRQSIIHQPTPTLTLTPTLPSSAPFSLLSPHLLAGLPLLPAPSLAAAAAAAAAAGRPPPSCHHPKHSLVPFLSLPLHS